MDSIQVDFERFRAIRARYVQVMYDLDGREEVQSRSIVHLDVDRAVHSGEWDGTLPVALDPLRESGLVVVWQIQNAFYNGFDRVQTDGRLSLWNRALPGGTGGGLRVGTMDGSEHIGINAIPPSQGDSIGVQRIALPDGSVNVLTLPYVLAAMQLRAGDRFTLPGFAPINGPGGGGIPWRGAIRVESTGEVTVGDRTVPAAWVLSARMDEVNGVTLDQVDPVQPGRRMSRLVISPEPPYLLGRANIMMTDSGEWAFVREFLGLVDWAEQPLPGSDLIDAAIWDIDLVEGGFTLKEMPRVLVPLRNR